MVPPQTPHGIMALFAVNYILFSFFRRAVRATLILLPLLGLHYILFPVKPKGNKVAETFYNYFIAVLLSFQVRIHTFLT